MQRPPHVQGSVCNIQQRHRMHLSHRQQGLSVRRTAGAPVRRHARRPVAGGLQTGRAVAIVVSNRASPAGGFAQARACLSYVPRGSHARCKANAIANHSLCSEADDPGEAYESDTDPHGHLVPHAVLVCTGAEAGVATIAFAVCIGGTVVVFGVGNTAMDSWPFMRLSLTEKSERRGLTPRDRLTSSRSTSSSLTAARTDGPLAFRSLRADSSMSTRW